LSVRFLHTADWQVGKPFGAIGGEAGHELRQQRIRTVERIAALARERAVDAVAVAGDAFDSNEVSDRTIDRTLEALKGYEGPWVFLPGNHDAALAHSVWTRMRRWGLPKNVIIADETTPLSPWKAPAALLPAPLTRRRETADQTAWFDQAATPEGHARIGLAHGSVAGRLPGQAEAANEIPAERAVRAGLSYLALGDWHGVIEIAPRSWYSGTPEPDRHRDNLPGHVNIVTVEGAGAEARIETVPVGHFRWVSLSVDIVDGRADALIEALAPLGEASRRCVVSLALTGMVGLAERARLEREIERWRARLHHIEVDDRLVDEPGEDDLDAIDRAGFVRVAIERLRQMAADPAGGDAAAARMALRMLYLDHLGQDP
jgi:DNA repair exonuclease SbcCD nuclease subunit